MQLSLGLTVLTQTGLTTSASGGGGTVPYFEPDGVTPYFEPDGVTQYYEP